MTTNGITTYLDSVGLADAAESTLRSAVARAEAPLTSLTALVTQVRDAATTAANLKRFKPELPWIDYEEVWEDKTRPLPLSEDAAFTIRNAHERLLRLAEAAEAALAAVKERHDKLHEDLAAVRAARPTLPESEPAQQPF